MKQLFIFSILLLALSCKKDKVTAPSVIPVPPTEITISGTSSSITITDINPDVQLNSYNQTAVKTIDINGDGSDDFKFSTTYGAACAGGSYGIISKVETVNGNSFILSDSIYISSDYDTANVLTQTTINENYPKVMSANDVVKIGSRWRNGIFTIAHKSGSNTFCGNGHHLNSGYWYGQTNKYIAVRYNNFLGWIKIDTQNAYINIYEYACSSN